MPDLHFQHWPEGVPHSIEPPAQSVWRNLADTAARVPDKVAIHYFGRAITYAELLAATETLAGWFQAQGVRRGDRVLLMAQNCPQWVIAYYAIHRADACVVPVNTMNRRAELEHLARDTGARLAVVGSELVDHVRPLLDAGDLDHLLVPACADMAAPDGRADLPEPLRDLTDADVAGPGLTRWSDAMAARHTPRPHEAGPDDLAVLLYTSGTTGAPKGCEHTHATLQPVIWGYRHFSPYTGDEVQLSVLPSFHVTGMQNGMNAPICAGSTVVLMTRWDRVLAGRLIAQHKVTMLRMITTMVIDLMNAPELPTFDLSSVQLIGAGGAAVPQGVAQRLKDLTGLEIIEGYGMSETIGVTHINPAHRPKQQCLGIPIFDVDCRVINPDSLEEMGEGEDGEIIIAARQVMKGYWRNPEATAQAILERDGKRFFRSGDIGHFDADGYFFMTDRLKRMINASGYKIWPAEVETLMHRHPDIAEACVIGVADQRRGETVKAFVVPRHGAALTEAVVIAWCRDQMAAYKVPRSVEFLDALPRSGSGKIQWRELQDREAGRRESA